MANEREDEKLLTVTEAAQRLSVSAATLRRWADEGEIKTIRLPRSGHRRFSPTEVDRKRREMGLDNSGQPE